MSLDILRHSYVDVERIDDMTIDELKDEILHLHGLLAQQKSIFQVFGGNSRITSRTFPTDHHAQTILAQ